jgi:hypothetical protein
MKPTKIYIIAFIVVIGSILISINIQHRSRMNSLNINHKQIKIFTERIEDFRKELNNNPDEVVTKADLASFTEINRYQSEKDKLYMDNKIELSKGFMGFPNYVLFILIVGLSVQLGSIRKQIEKQSGRN